jgi:hypothetical protein
MSPSTSTTTRPSSAMNSARDTAHRALFSAASRVLSYHAAAMDAKVARMTREQDVEKAPVRLADARHN